MCCACPNPPPYGPNRRGALGPWLSAKTPRDRKRQRSAWLLHLQELRLGSFDDVVRSKSKFFLEHLQRCGGAECLHAEDGAVQSDVAAPSEGGSLLNGDAGADSWRQHRLAVFFGLPFKQLPGRHAHNAS